MDNVFISACLTDKVKLKPKLITKDYSRHILAKLRATYEGRCTYHGYIKPGSINIVKISVGLVRDFSLNGDTCFNVVYYADVCNPTVGSTVKAKVVNTNMFGILAENGLEINGKYYPILEIIIAKNSSTASASDIDLDKISIGHVINVEVIGKKFELDDTKMTVIGKVIESHKQRKELDGGGNDLSDGEESAGAEDEDADEESVEAAESSDDEAVDEESAAESSDDEDGSYMSDYSDDDGSGESDNESEK